MENESPEEGKILCCECGRPIAPNPANMCVACLRTRVDITEGIPKQVSMYFCKGCERYFQPPTHWVRCALESRELLAICLKKLKGLNKVNLVDASFVWTEPHSKRLKVKLVIQKEVMGGTILQQTFIVEYVIQGQMCTDCHRVEAKDFWKAVVQLRQKVSHKKTFFYLEQLILKHSIHRNTLNIKQHDNGLDFFFSHVDHARKMTDFFMSVVPCKYKTAKELVSHDVHSNTYNYKNTFSVEIAPVNKDSVVCLPKKLASQLGNMSQLCVCIRVTNVMQFIDPNTLQMCDINAQTYWRTPFVEVADLKHLTEYTVLQVERIDGANVKLGAGHGMISKKHLLADVWVMRTQDMGVVDQQYHCRSHLGHLLRAGDTVMGFDVTTSNVNNKHMETIRPDMLPDVVLVKKVFGDRKRRHQKRKWKLKSLTKEEELMNTEETQRDYIGFLEDLEEDPEYRKNVNIYIDRSKVVPVEASESGDDEAPQISLQEMMDDLNISDGEEIGGAVAAHEEMT